jgi:PAS domain S-box-containing protein
MNILRLWRSNLQFRLISTVLLLVLLGILAVTGVLTVQAQNSLREETQANEAARLQVNVEELNLFLQISEQDIQYLSSSSSVLELAAALQNEAPAAEIQDRREEVAADFLVFAQNAPIYTQIRFFNLAGDELVRIDNTGQEVFIVPDEQLQNKADRGYFTGTLGQAPGGIYISALDLNREGSPPTIVGSLADDSLVPVLRYGAPVYLPTEEGGTVLAGVVVTNVFADQLLGLISQGTAEDAQTYFLNQEGYYLFNTAQPERVFGFEPGIETVGGVAGAQVSQDFAPDEAQTFLAAQSLQNLSTEDGRLVFYERVRPPGAPEGYYWVLVFTRDEAAIFAAAAQFLQAAALLTLLVLFILGAVLVYSTRQIIQPLEDLTQGAALIAEGQFQKPLAVAERPDEIGVLGQALNRMSGQLQNLVQNLEGQVSERTRELAATIEVGLLSTNQNSLEEMLPSIADYIQQRFSLYYVQVYLLDEGKRYLILKHGTGEAGQALLARQHRLDMSQTSIVTQAAQTGVSTLVENTQNSSLHKANPLLPATRSEVAIPLIVGGEILGALDLQDSQANRFNADNLYVFEAMANQLASNIRAIQVNQASLDLLVQMDQLNRQLTAEAWTPYLEDLNQGQKVGYFYDLEAPRPLSQVAEGLTAPSQLHESITLRDLPLGRIRVADNEGRKWTEEEQRLMGGVAERVAQTLEQMRAADALQIALQDSEDLATQLRIVAEVATQASRILETDELLHQVSELTKSSFKLYHTHIYLMDHEALALKLVAGAGEAGAMMLKRGHTIPLSKKDSLVATAARTAQAQVSNDVRLAATFLPNPLLPDTRSELAIPLMAAGQVLGVLDVQSEQVNRFTDNDIKIKTVLAGQVGIAIQNARAYEAAEKARQETQRIFDSSIDMLGSANFEGYFLSLNPSWERILGWNRAELMAEPFISFVHPEDVQATLDEAGKIAGGASAISFINRYRTKDGGYRQISWNSAADLANSMIHFVARDITEQRAQEAQIQRRAQELQTVAEVSTRATSTLDVQELLLGVVNLTKERFGLYHAHIYLLDATGQNLVLAAGAGQVGQIMARQGRSIALSAEHSLVAQAGREGRGVMSNDVTQAPNFLPNPLLPDTQSELAVPLLVAGQLLGVLDVQSDELGHFSDLDLQIQSTLAGQVASAVRNARLFQETVAQQKELTDFKSALDTAAIVAITDQTGKIQYVNDLFCEVSQYSRAELIGQDHRLINSGYHPKEFIREVWVTIANGRTWQGEFCNRAKDGSLYWVNTSIIPFLNEQGKPFQYIAIRYLITDRKQAEALIEQRAQQLQTVAEVSTRATSILEVAALLHEVVELTKDRFGLYHAHIYLLDEEAGRLNLAAGAGEVGQMMLNRQHHIRLDKQDSLVATAARTQAGVTVNDVTQAPNFLPNPLLPETRAELAVPLIAGGQLLGVLDVQSEQVGRFGPEDVQIQTTLAAQVAAALQNARLYNEQLETAEQLREVDRLKSEFLASMSHELRTPLNSIIGYAEVILDGIDGPINEDVTEDVGAIYSSGKLLLSLINDILDLAKIEANQLALDSTALEVSGILNDAVDTATILVKDKAVALKIEIEPGLPAMWADRLRVQQILNNLISNAAKFTDQGSITVRALRQNKMIRVEVCDTGMGIKAEQLGLIFERFRQADQSSTRRAGGTGLGLAITRQLVEIHGGQIGVESDYGHGSTFWFTMPMAQQAAGQPAAD